MSLTPAVVLDAAIAYLDETGLEEFSARRLATRLGVRVGALYWHYPSKQALLDAVAERIIAEASAVPVPDGEWPDQLRAIAQAHRAAMLAHTDGARVIAGLSTPGPNALAFIERPIGLLVAAGMDRPTARAAADVLTSYVNGFTIEEQARKLDQDRADRDRDFGFGVEAVLRGLRSGRSGRPSGTP